MQVVGVTRCARHHRLRHASAAVIGSLAVLLCAAGTARAQVRLPSGPTPLGGSNFQGGDGNQDDASPYVDWQAFEHADPKRVVHNPDTGWQFGAGSNEDSPGEWRLIPEGAGVNPPKANIFDAWSAVDQPADSFLYLGFTREQGQGTTTIAFELNQDARTWDNDDDRDTPAIPCRRDGDVLIVFDAHGGDSTAMDVRLEKWVTEATDPTVGCDTQGHLAVASTKAPVADYGQGSSNPGPITSRLPGHFPDGSQIPEARLFAEAALNLSDFFAGGSGDSCFAFASIWMHSRASIARASDHENSRLKDYLAPGRWR